MKSLKSFFSLALLVMLSVTSGCITWRAEIEDMSFVYSKPPIAGAPKIVMNNLLDKRSDKKLVGKICALKLATKRPINVIITNRIASKLREDSFNVQKVQLTYPESKIQVVKVLQDNRGTLFLSGILDYFYIESFDAIMEPARGEVEFRIYLLDKNGKSIFDRIYFVHTRKHIGLGGGPGSEKFIKATIKATVDKLFNDIDFLKVLSQFKN